MVEFTSRYQARKTDAQGYVTYSDEENAVWRHLYERQVKLMPGYACDEHIEGLKILDLSSQAIPQLPDVNNRMGQATGWQVAPVSALISPQKFFQLLADRTFPAATFIRSEEEIDYVKEPDIFHELFGHCPMLTQPVFADFVRQYAKNVLTFDQKDWPLLQRIFWFTMEFGLIKLADSSLRIYGGGILSSFSETQYAVDSDIPQRKPFDPLDILRTPYRIDLLQPIYFVIDSYQMLYDNLRDTESLMKLLQQAHELGEHPPVFPVEPDNPNIHIYAC